jgi:adenylosuccinate lyase
VDDGEDGLAPERLDAVHRAMRRSAGLELAQLERYLPFLATTKVLVAAVQRGVGREAAHEAIKEAAVGAALDLRKGAVENDVVDRLAADPSLKLSKPDIWALMAEPIEFTGAAVAQTQAVVRRVEQVVADDPDAATYAPGGIL